MKTFSEGEPSRRAKNGKSRREPASSESHAATLLSLLFPQNSPLMSLHGENR